MQILTKICRFPKICRMCKICKMIGTDRYFPPDWSRNSKIDGGGALGEVKNFLEVWLRPMGALWPSRVLCSRMDANLHISVQNMQKYAEYAEICRICRICRLEYAEILFEIYIFTRFFFWATAQSWEPQESSEIRLFHESPVLDSGGSPSKGHF